MIRTLVRRFLKDGSAVAAVEFALILPLLVTLYFGTVEAASLYTVDRRVATVASTMADLVSRERKCISEDTLDTYFNAATSTMRPYSTGELKQVVSMLSVDKDTGEVSVIWSEPYGTGATARTSGDIATAELAPKINALARNKGWLVAAEIQYPYTPLFGIVIKNINLAHTEFFLPRYEDKVALGCT